MVNQVLLNMYKEIIIPSLVFTLEIELNIPLQPMSLLKVELSKIRKLKMSPLQTQNVAHCVTTSFWEITCSELPKNYKVTVLSDDVFFLDSSGRSRGLTAAAPVPFPLCLHNAFWSHTLTWLKNSLNKNKLFLGEIPSAILFRTACGQLPQYYWRAVNCSMQFEISSMSFAAGEDTSDYFSVFQKWMGNGALSFCPDLFLLFVQHIK